MSRIISLSVITNSHLSALSRACELAKRHWGLNISVTLFSSLPLDALTIKAKQLRKFYPLPHSPRQADYEAIVATPEFVDSSSCLLFFTRLVPACIYSELETINFHPSLLPEHAGLRGYESAIAARQLAITAHRVDASVDGGAILRQYAISPYPENSSPAHLQKESSLLCSAAILSLLRDRVLHPFALVERFSSGQDCLKSILAGKNLL